MKVPCFTGRWNGCTNEGGGWKSFRGGIRAPSGCAAAPLGEASGVFVALDNFDDAITFLEPSKPGYRFTVARTPATGDLSLQPMA